MGQDSNENENKKRNENVAKQQSETLKEKKRESFTEDKDSFAGLTKRNEDYMFRLNRHLEEEGVSEEKRKEAIEQMTVELLEKQKQGVVAAKYYGTVSERAQEIISGPKKVQAPPAFWKIALDNGLMIFTLFCVMYAALTQFAVKTGQTNSGILTLVVTSVFAGVGMAYFYRIAAQRRSGAKKMPFWKVILLSLIFMVVWVAVYTITDNIPLLNRPLPVIAYAILAVLSYGSRYLLKKKLNIPSKPF
ncbi:DUF1129 domain-containing protein [Liquorilactobacillus oeni]|uniref:DUF1129 domain-containing protein n=1 Tax=Liquorilactobacillus oeni TaxID=303241 RepID=UPI000B021960|nr:DUF1129 domain-containing protein [Liquorilactobacillus oeni]